VTLSGTIRSFSSSSVVAWAIDIDTEVPWFEHRRVLTELAERDDGTVFRDADVRQRLFAKGFENPAFGSAREWVRCTPDDVLAAIAELRAGQTFSGTHHETFAPRREQTEAVEKAHAYYESIWAENPDAVPRFLWNAKMRFGKTFAAYQLAKRLDAKRALVVTFKPAVEDAWKTDLETHIDFDGWQYLSRTTGGSPRLSIGGITDGIRRNAALSAARCRYALTRKRAEPGTV